MTMKDVSDALTVLVELQLVDRQLRDRQRSLTDMSQTVNEKNKRAKDVEDRIQLEKDKLKHLGMDSSKWDLDIKSIVARMGKLRAQLNLVKHQKEYDTLLHEIAALEADRNRAEDEMLAMMTGLDDVRNNLEALQKELATAKAAVAEEQTRTNEQVRLAGVEMRQLRSERAALVTRLNPDIHKKYERILQNKGENAIVEVVGHVCSGCNMGVTKQSLSRLMALREIIQCPNCMRILYLKEQE